MYIKKPEKTQAQKHEAAMERVFAKVEATGFCWLWTAAKTTDGYGITTLYGRTECAHRAVWMLLIGPIAKGLQLDHLCEVRACVNPDHLEPVTKRENAARMVERKGWAHGGHKPFGPQPKPIPRKTGPYKQPLSVRGVCIQGHDVAAVGYVVKAINGVHREVCLACEAEYKRRNAAQSAKIREAACAAKTCSHVRCGTRERYSFKREAALKVA